MGKFDRTSPAATRSRPPNRKSGGGTLLGVFIGLVIGISIAFGVVWYLNKSPLPFQNKYEGAPKADRAATAGGTAAATTPAPLPGKPGDKPSGRFEFYDILEGKQPATPGTVTPRTAPPVAPPPAPGEVKTPVTIFFLQVGAFQKPADADNLKAKLALSGLEASVQEVSIPEKGTMHRVRVGPFRDPDEMNRARVLLSQSGIQGTVIKQTE